MPGRRFIDRDGGGTDAPLVRTPMHQALYVGIESRHTEKMLPANFRTARLFLRPIAMADAGQIFAAYARNPEITNYLIWRPHRTRIDIESYIRSCLGTPPHRARTYVLLGRKDSVIRGCLDLRQADRHRLEFGYVLARAWWGQGLMTEALTEIVRWGLTQPSIFRISAVCDVENIGSARVMEKSGLVREGLLRRWLVHPGISKEPRDCFSYALVR
jgi:ribosomal-protein-alanine N-acetyltransferase